MYVPLVVVYTVWVCVPPSLSFGRGRTSGCGGSRLPLRCHRQRDISRRCRNQQRGGQSGRLPSECSETTPAWICRYNPGQATIHPYACPRFIPTFSVRSPSGGSSPVELVLSRGVCPYISPVCAYLPFSSPSTFWKNVPLHHLSPFSPALALPSHLSLSTTDTPSRPTQPTRPSLSYFLRSRQVFVYCPPRRVSFYPSHPNDRASFNVHRLDPR